MRVKRRGKSRRHLFFTVVVVVVNAQSWVCTEKGRDQNKENAGAGARGKRMLEAGTFKANKFIFGAEVIGADVNVFGFQ
jgi:hypothetical protein